MWGYVPDKIWVRSDGLMPAVRKKEKRKSLPEVEFRKAFVELMVIETTTSSMRTKRSTN